MIFVSGMHTGLYRLCRYWWTCEYSFEYYSFQTKLTKQDKSSRINPPKKRQICIDMICANLVNKIIGCKQVLMLDWNS